MTHRIVSNPSILQGTPTFEGTRLSVSHIQGLLKRFGDDILPEIRRDYPYLTDEDIENARNWDGSALRVEPFTEFHAVLHLFDAVE